MQYSIKMPIFAGKLLLMYTRKAFVFAHVALGGNKWQ